MGKENLQEYADCRQIKITSISVTHNCNLNCKMCGQANYKKSVGNLSGFMSDETFSNVVDKIEVLAPSKVFLWGGEPLLHPSIAHMINTLKSKKFFVGLITNGLLLRKKVDELLASKLDTVCVSIDGVGEIHDSIRGVKGAYDRTIEGLKFLLERKKFRPVVSINIVINDLNYRNLYYIVEEFSKMEVNGIQIQFPVFFSQEIGEKSCAMIRQTIGIETRRWKGFVCDHSNIDVNVLQEQINKIKKNFKNVYFYPADIPALEWFDKTLCSDNVHCLHPWSRLNIEPNANVHICGDYGDMVVGNLNGQTLQAIWNNEKYRAFRRLLIDNHYLPICKHCTYAYLNKN